MTTTDHTPPTRRSTYGSTGGSSRRHRDGRRSPFGAMLRTEARLMTRDPAFLVWSVVLPVAAIVVLSLAPGTRRPRADLGGLSFAQVYQPTLVLCTVTLVGVQVFAQMVATYRDLGVLRRLQATPMAPGILLGAVMTLLCGVSTVVCLLLVVVPWAAGLGTPASPGAFLAGAVLASVSSLGLGAIVAGLARSAAVATGVGLVLSAVLWFFAGLWVPRAAFPGWLDTIASFTPTGAASRVMLDSLTGGDPGWLPYAVVLAWSALLLAVAMRVFRWT